MIGRTIGKYRIVGQLGRGGAGIVYKAVDETLNRDVAVKTLNPDLANTEVMSRFRAEATILAKLNHPQIATIFELFRSENDLLMVMEFVRGETLDKLSERLGPIAPDRAAYLIDLILSALEHAHREGVVHRDVKPANVMVTNEGSIKIMDFGIARVLNAEQKTVDFRLMGTPAYMSPEQVMGEEVDGRSDLYSVGVLFYRLLTGALPFTADTALSMLQRQIRDTPTPVHVHRPSLPAWCDQIVQRALAKTPADRFQSAEEFRDALGRATGPLPAADFAKTFAVADGQNPPVPVLGPTDTIDLSRHEAVVSAPMAASVSAPVAPRRVRQELHVGGDDCGGGRLSASRSDTRRCRAEPRNRGSNHPRARWRRRRSQRIRWTLARRSSARRWPRCLSRLGGSRAELPEPEPSRAGAPRAPTRDGRTRQAREGYAASRGSTRAGERPCPRRRSSSRRARSSGLGNRKSTARSSCSPTARSRSSRRPIRARRCARSRMDA